MKKKKLIALGSSILAISILLAGCAGATSAYRESESYANATPASGYASSTADSFNAVYAATEKEALYDATEEAIYDDVDVDEEAATTEGGEASPLAPATPAVAQKIVRSADIYLETKEYAEGVILMRELEKKYGAYNELSQIAGTTADRGQYSARTATYVVRVPSKHLDAYIEDLHTSFFVRNFSESAENITRTYFDNKAVLEGLTEQKARLEKMLDTANDLQYMLQIEREIASIDTQIKTVHSRIETMDVNVDNSTVRVTLTEVIEYVPNDPTPTITFGSRARYAFEGAIESTVDVFQGITLFFISNFPVLIFLVLVALFLIWIIRRDAKKKKEKTRLYQESLAAPPPAQVNQDISNIKNGSAQNNTEHKK